MVTGNMRLPLIVQDGSFPKNSKEVTMSIILDTRVIIPELTVSTDLLVTAVLNKIPEMCEEINKASLGTLHKSTIE
jgi:hypothetical protein